MVFSNTFSLDKKFETIRTQLEELYRNILERKPDEIGLNYWQNMILEKNITIDDVKKEFYNSQEYEQLDQKYNFTNDKNTPRGFFDDYQRFFSTSKTVEHPNHLNGRFKAIIESNLNIIKDSSILDIASHDGRWSFAALKNGAKNVLGIEARQHLVTNANDNMIAYGISPNSYRFIINDVHNEIKQLESNKFDIIFCLDFLYHTIDHWFLLSEIKRLNPKYVIIDTRIDPSNEKIIKLHVDYHEKEAHAFSTQSSKKKILVGTPSKSSLEMMLTCLGFTNFEYFDWKNKIKNFRNLVDYYHEKRITLVAHNPDN